MEDSSGVGNRAPEVSPAVPDAPILIWRTLLAVLERLPQGALSRGFGALADVHLPRPFRGAVLRGFARGVGVDLSEAEHPPEAYPSLGAFFVRRLREGLRSWPQEDAAAGCPVDGVVGQFGAIRGGRAIQAKGRDYSVADLLDDPDGLERYDGGSFLTLYLSPRHYHRIHAPVTGSIPVARHVPGGLLPVNAPAVAGIPNLFARNERLVCYVDGPLGRMAVVAVGAFNVGRISAAFDPDWGGPAVTNRRGAQAETRRYEPPIQVARGAEIMAFHLGSTVVCLWEPGRVQLAGELQRGREIHLGEVIARA